jgi:hypothetical protein
VWNRNVKLKPGAKQLYDCADGIFYSLVNFRDRKILFLWLARLKSFRLAWHDLNTRTKLPKKPEAIINVVNTFVLSWLALIDW